MTNGIQKLFFDNVKNIQINNVISNYLKENNWELGDHIMVCFGESNDDHWYHISFNHKNTMMTMNIGYEYKQPNQGAYFYEMNVYSISDCSKFDSFYIDFTDLNEWEYYFNKFLKATMDAVKKY